MPEEIANLPALRMKAITTSTRSAYLTDLLKPSDSNEESPPDRELRRLHNLSREVGIACSAWLTKRGIKTRSWGEFNVRRSPRKPARLELQLENDS